MTKFKSLSWHIDERTFRGDRKYNTEKAEIEIRLPDGRFEIYRSYTLHRGASIETDDIWFLSVFDDHDIISNTKVDTLENGKRIAEKDYQEYMNLLYNGMSKYITESDPIKTTDDTVYCNVVKEHFNCDCERTYENIGCKTLNEAVDKAQEVAKEFDKIFHNQDRVFIKVGNLYYNPDRQLSDMMGVAWNHCA